jgi:outer membrane protein OmpA-like peptidoglycan-associated protein
MKQAMLVFSLMILWPISAFGDEACEKAREYYRHGVELLRYEDRKEAFRKATELCPNYADAFVNLADACENLHEYDKAGHYYNKALSIKPGLFAGLVGLAELCLKSGRYQKAYDTFLKCQAIKPDNESVKSGLKVASHQLKRGRKFLASNEIISCLQEDSVFQVMCMCPGEKYAFMKTRVCIPNVEFNSNSISPTAEGRRQLDEIGKALQSLTLNDTKLLLTGHADSFGSPDTNMKLSENRTVALMEYLTSKYGVNRDLITIRFLGADWPIADNGSAWGRQRNRRVEILLDEAQ